LLDCYFEVGHGAIRYMLQWKDWLPCSIAREDGMIAMRCVETRG
jgi:hypothetical protein